MEQLLFRVHTRVLTVTNRCLSPSLRRSIEVTTLLAAIATVAALVALHVTYVLHDTDTPNDCISTALLRLDEDLLRRNGSSLSLGDGEGERDSATRRRERVLKRLREEVDLIAIKIDAPPPWPWQTLSWTHWPSPRSERNTHAAVSLTQHTYTQPTQHNHTCENTPTSQTDTQRHTHTTCESESEKEREIGPGIRVSQFVSSSRHYTTHTPHTYLFSFSRAALMLTQEPPTQHHFSFHTLQFTFQPRECACFGPGWSRELVNSFPSLYDVVVMNWALRAFRAYATERDAQQQQQQQRSSGTVRGKTRSGFLFNIKSREMFNLNYATQFVAKKGVNIAETSLSRRERVRSVSALSEFLSSVSERLYYGVVWVYARITTHEEGERERETETDESERETRVSHTRFAYKRVFSLAKDLLQFLAFRCGVLLSTTFIFFISSSLVSYVLRDTQERMLRFTFLLQYHITRNLPYYRIIFTHVTSSLIFVPIIMGIYFFMFEFFADQLLAFLVLLVVWIGEVFSILSLRSAVSIKYFPMIFTMYFYLFHMYFFCFPFGFVYLALLAITLLVLHAMMHFWNAFEVPAFLSGRLTAQHPRMYTHALTPSLHTPTPPTQTQSPPNTTQTHNNTPSTPPHERVSVSARHTPLRPLSLSSAEREAHRETETQRETVSDASHNAPTQQRVRALSLSSSAAPRAAINALSQRATHSLHEPLEARRERLAAAQRERETERETEREKRPRSHSDGLSPSLSPHLTTQPPHTTSARNTHNTHDTQSQTAPSSSAATRTLSLSLPVPHTARETERDTERDSDDYGFFLERDSDAELSLSPASPFFHTTHRPHRMSPPPPPPPEDDEEERQRDPHNASTQQTQTRSRHHFVNTAINHVDSNLHKYTVNGSSSHVKSKTVSVMATEATPRGEDKKFTIFGSFDDMYG